MGFWDTINSTAEAVNRYAPIPTPIKQACITSYGYCYSAGGKVVNAVRSSPQIVSNYVPDPETRSQIGLFAYKFAQNSAAFALRESYKVVPGGKEFAEIVGKTMRDVKSESRSKNKEAAKVKEIAAAGGGKATGDESPEDVLRVFMMKEFMGNRFADDLLLPQLKYANKKSRKI